ncbi:MAG: hypothetical protein IJP23_02955 [Oscillospiraceae bacterium]|nr:hypothetical protein [Oscillospiraceae bacterium]
MAKTNVEKRAAKEARRKQQDALTYRILIVVVAAFISILVIKMLENMFNTAATSWGAYYFFCAVGILGIVLLVLGIVLFIVNVVKKGRIGSAPLSCIVAGIILAFTGSTIYNMGAHGFGRLLVLYPIVAVLFLVYYIFQKEFFLISLLTAACAYLQFSLSRTLGGFSATLAVCILAVICVVIALLCQVIRKKDGMLSTRLEGIRVFGSKAIYTPVYITCAVVIVVSFVGLLAGSLVAYILMFVMLAYFIATAVYYATKML